MSHTNDVNAEANIISVSGIIMATTIKEMEQQEQQSEQPELPDASVLEDRTPEWLKAPASLAGFALFFSLMLVFFGGMHRLSHTDIWGHLAYGRHIAQTGALPATEPLMPLSKGMPMVDIPWLSQYIGYQTITRVGIPAIQFLYALSLMVCCGLLVRRCYVRGINPWWTFLGLVALLSVSWMQILIVRPQVSGMVCFMVLLFIATRRKPSKADWFLMPAVFALWANLHGSFPVGWAFLLAWTVGRFADVLCRSKSLRLAVRDREFHRRILLAELGAAGALLTPHGFKLFVEVLQFGAHPNLANLVEWQPLQLWMIQLRMAVIAAIVLAVLYRLTPRRISVVEVLLFAGFGVSMFWTSRMILWWAPVTAWLIALHGNAVWKKFRKATNKPNEEMASGAEDTVAMAPKRGLWMVVAVGVLWIGFAVTPMGHLVLHGEETPEEKMVSRQTPIEATKYLLENPPKGQVFNTMEYGDYLLWAGPKDLEIFVASHAHLVPKEVWRDYMRITRYGKNWEVGLDRYSINTVFVNNIQQARMIETLLDNEEWSLAYQDKQTTILTRNDPIE